jgi:hypothetical protein
MPANRTLPLPTPAEHARLRDGNGLQSLRYRRTGSIDVNAALMLLERAAAQPKLIIDAAEDRAMTTLLVRVRYRCIP